MKLSLKMRDREQQHHHNPLLRAKLPICVLGLPFTSSIVAGDPTDLSFSIQTNFTSGPSFKLAYSPSATTATPSTVAATPSTVAATVSPFSLSLKSGVGLFGSPINSPFTISAHFSLLLNSNSHQPTFSLQVKPQLGDFSLKRTIGSSYLRNSNPNPFANGGGVGLKNGEGDGFVSVDKRTDVQNPNSNEGFGVDLGGGRDGFLPLVFGDDNPKTSEQNARVYSNGGSKSGFGLEKPSLWRDFRMESCCGKDGILSGFAVRARTVLPVMKGVNMNFRWGLNVPAEFGKKMPFLTVNKIGIERVVGVKEVKVKNGVGDMELLKGMCFCMSRDLQALGKENVEMKESLEKVRLATSARNHSSVKIVMPSSDENASDFEQWKAKKNGGEENGGSKKSATRASDMESELKRAIKSATP